MKRGYQPLGGVVDWQRSRNHAPARATSRLVCVGCLVVLGWALTAGRSLNVSAREAPARNAEPVGEIVEIDLSARRKEVYVEGRPRQYKVEGTQAESLAGGEMRLEGYSKVELPDGTLIHVRSGTLRLVKDEAGRLTRMLIYPTSAPRGDQGR